nr:MAG TPA: hypothetical protein [Caudoviricetes sp.]DAX80721.1 MAG TPA: hypothetical protein [Caudoviricetes sp.]
MLRGRRYCDAPLTPAVLASPKNAQTVKIFSGPFRFARVAGMTIFVRSRK